MSVADERCTRRVCQRIQGRDIGISANLLRLILDAGFIAALFKAEASTQAGDHEQAKAGRRWMI